MLQKKKIASGYGSAASETFNTAQLWCQIVILHFHLPLPLLLFFISPDFFLGAFDLFSIVIVQAFHAQTFQVRVIQP